MLIYRHSPDDCAFRDDTSREALMSGLDSLSVTASEQGASVEGIWLNMAAHTIFVLIDAPDAHSVDRAIRDANLIGRTSSEVFAVMTFQALKDINMRVGKQEVVVVIGPSGSASRSSVSCSLESAPSKSTRPAINRLPPAT